MEAFRDYGHDLIRSSFAKMVAPQPRSDSLLTRNLHDTAQTFRHRRSGFELKRVGQETLDFASAIYLSDGTINLALLNYHGKRGSGLDDAKNFVGAHHFGFQVDDIAAVQARIEAAGGTFFFDLGEDQEKENFERKFKDPEGIIFDISKKGWLGTR